jgi:tryptophanyl-tRNA synthetase
MLIATADVVSGIQPTGQLHLGNYFGAVSNWVALQHSYSCVYLVVDLHAMTTAFEPRELRQNTAEMLINLMACGIDPEKSTLLVQSLIPEHTFLQWILSCFCSSADLVKMPQYKEQLAATGFGSAGLLTYPVLQAADILAYKARYVPVGKDQERHLELARDIARKFNSTYKCKLFPEPELLFTSTPRIMSLTDPARKMSKSPGDCIGLFDDAASIRSKIKKAVTDSGTLAEGAIGPGVRNLLEILKACGKRSLAQELENDCLASGSRQYSKLKKCTADALVQLTSDLKSRRDEIIQDQDRLFSIIREKSAEARKIVRHTLREVCDQVGLLDNAYLD